MSQWPIDWRATVDEAVRRRKQENLTQAQLAALAGVSRPTVVAFEQGDINLRFERVIAILDALGLFVQPGRADSLQAFVYQARNRFAELVDKLDNDHPSRHPRGYSEQAYAISGVKDPPTLTGLKGILGHAPKTSGWTPFWVPTKETIKPTFQNGLIECWLGRLEADKLFNDPAHADFWQVTREGSAYLRRGFQEDGPDLDAGNFFDLTLPIWRTAEVLRHSAWLAEQLGAGPDDGIRFDGRYSGLTGRELISWAKPGLRFAFDDRYRSRSDSVGLNTITSGAEIVEDIDAVVSRILQPLYERFEGFVAPQSLISSQIAEFERGLEENR